ncbi:hypothetical protein EAI_14127 [Harpegnathos saltator]|uniref:Uncharacterized protein n=1 Tax=Harpegnathos saltator TaxID=610380 RepID=E2BSJ7_HARSA|nr:hypothetical protein EAI_14127 [Harpegnathos saltator]
MMPKSQRELVSVDVASWIGASWNIVISGERRLENSLREEARSMRSFAVKCIDSLPDRCLEVVSLDIDEIEDHLSKINLTDVPTVKMMAAGFKCPISALPFGALKSDWSRLMLLQEAQPDGSIIKRKLIRIMRVLIIAYYQMEESFDVVKSGAQILQQSQEKEMTTTKVEVTTAKVVPSSSRELNATTRISFVPIEIRIPNVTSPIDLGAVNARYHPVGTLKTAATAVAGNAASRTLDNCLRQSLKDVLSRNRPNRTSHGDVVFERLKGKNFASNLVDHGSVGEIASETSDQQQQAVEVKGNIERASERSDSSSSLEKPSPSSPVSYFDS